MVTPTKKWNQEILAPLFLSTGSDASLRSGLLCLTFPAGEVCSGAGSAICASAGCLKLGQVDDADGHGQVDAVASRGEAALRRIDARARVLIESGPRARL